MNDIRELNRKRCELAAQVRYMGAHNTPTDPEERLRSDAQYRLVSDAWLAAESAYQKAIGSLTPDQLREIADAAMGHN